MGIFCSCSCRTRRLNAKIFKFYPKEKRCRHPNFMLSKTFSLQSLPVKAITLVVTYNILCRCTLLENHLVFCTGWTGRTAWWVFSAGECVSTAKDTGYHCIWIYLSSTSMWQSLPFRAFSTIFAWCISICMDHCELVIKAFIGRIRSLHREKGYQLLFNSDKALQEKLMRESFLNCR